MRGASPSLCLSVSLSPGVKPDPDPLHARAPRPDPTRPPRRKLVKHILSRSTEALARPAAITSLRDALSSASTFVSSARADATALAASDPEAPQRFTSDELDKLDSLVRDTAAWLADAEARQGRLEGHEDPAVRVAEVDKRQKEVEREVGRLEKKKAPRRRKAGSPRPETVKPEPPAQETQKEHTKDEL